MDVPGTMRAVVTTHHGGLEALQVRQVPVPAPGPGEVLVKVAAAGCNNTDLWTREGTYGSGEDPPVKAGWLGPVDFPRIQGGDVAGVVVRHGPAVEGYNPPPPGTQVLVDPALYASNDDDALPVDVLGSERDGGFAEYVVVPASCVHDVDASPLSNAELGALPIAYGTALGMLERGRAEPGDTVVVTGASGGVGLAAVQLARARGCTVVAVCSGSKATAVGEAGATRVVDRSKGSLVADLGEAVGDGADVVVDVVAGEWVASGIELLRPGGRWVVAGALGGHEVRIDVRRLYLANKALLGSTMHTPAVFRKLADIARAGEVRPVVSATYELEQLGEAQRALQRREHVGKLVVLP